MGSDLTVVNAARVSFHKESTWESSAPLSFDLDDVMPVLSEKDQKLINYLAKNNHFTPFTHCMITLREKVPIFVARQRFKHTVGFSYNEVSRRYVDDEPEFFEPKEWRKKAENVKQGSSDETLDLTKIITDYEQGWYKDLRDLYECVQMDQLRLYNEMIKAGVAPEQARMVLPQSMYTEYYVTGSLSAFARAYKLRSDPHAQKEIQEVAIEWDKVIRPLFPRSWSALVD
jgi:thymidylate synthase (FAD)